MPGGAPKGNNNATKTKAWSNALRRELAGEQNAEKLAALAKKVYQDALSGNMQAVKEIGDRLDGKPVQAVEGTGENGLITIAFSNLDEEVL